MNFVSIFIGYLQDPHLASQILTQLHGIGLLLAIFVQLKILIGFAILQASFSVLIQECVFSSFKAKVILSG